jgi:phosphoribosylanthranilate isomerase
VAPDIKFCGLTRSIDARFAAELGAAYAGVIFAGGPRHLTIEQAAAVLADLPASIKRVGVFGSQTTEEVASIASILALDVVQLHDRGDPSSVSALRKLTSAEIWSVLRLSRGFLPENSKAIASAVDGVVLDAYVPGALGGTGVALPWQELADGLADLRFSRLILAGGLRPENLAKAISLVAPDVVDVSSGVEIEVGIKDRDRMRAFRDAARQASIPTHD